MKLLFDSFWRAVLDCFRPRVLLLSVLPLLATGLLAAAFGYWYWDASLAWVRDALQASTVASMILSWLQSLGLGDISTLLAPLIVILGITPAIVVLSLLSVALLMAPALNKLVAGRRFATLERKEGGSWLSSLAWSLLSTLLALLAWLVSLPLWLIPPLVLLLPPLIWGWLTYRVMAFDALASHASRAERQELLHRHRLRLFGMGVVCGYLGAAPSVIWASGILFAAAFVVLLPIGIWLYTWIFAFSSLWFAHYSLHALQRLRQERAPDHAPDSNTATAQLNAP